MCDVGANSGIHW